MKTHLMNFVLSFGLVIQAFSTTTCLAQGNLTPPGPPTPTMKSLDQIETRTPISSAPFTISQPGSYYLTGNLTVSTGNAITIATNSVRLDLNGFTISSTAPSATANGISLNTGLRSITIMNGFIQGGVTNNGTNVYSGGGFSGGISYSGVSPVNVLISGISASGCLDYGIYLNTGDSTVVEFCTARTVGIYGILAASVKNCSASDCGGTAIFGDVVSDCRGQSTGGGFGIYASSVAENCYGFCNAGTGISGFILNGCHGASGTGTALSATHNVNSF